MGDGVRIALIGDYDAGIVAHQAIPLALEMAGTGLGCQVRGEWIGTASITDAAEVLGAYDAVWCVPGSPYASMDGALRAISWARESGRPFLGTCGGFQHALIEYARNVLGYGEADHAESNPVAVMPLIAPLACPLRETPGLIRFTAGSRLAAIYGADEATEGYNCGFGLNPDYAGLLDDGRLVVTGRDEAGQVRAVELASHPFYMATLFQPERAALAGRAHPLIGAFVAAAVHATIGAV